MFNKFLPTEMARRLKSTQESRAKREPRLYMVVQTSAESIHKTASLLSLKRYMASSLDLTTFLMKVAYNPWETSPHLCTLQTNKPAKPKPIAWWSTLDTQPCWPFFSTPTSNLNTPSSVSSMLTSKSTLLLSVNSSTLLYKKWFNRTTLANSSTTMKATWRSKLAI